MLVTLDIDDEEISFFIKLARSLPFVNEITSAEDNLETILGPHLLVLKERLENIETTQFTDTAEFISTLK